jgi:hypothetical protein
LPNKWVIPKKYGSFKNKRQFIFVDRNELVNEKYYLQKKDRYG